MWFRYVICVKIRSINMSIHIFRFTEISVTVLFPRTKRHIGYCVGFLPPCKRQNTVMKCYSNKRKSFRSWDYIGGDIFDVLQKVRGGSCVAKEYVVEGATLKCTLGVASGKLLVTPPHRVKLTGKNRANIGDTKPFANIPSFGACKITSPPKPCTPACAMWLSGKTDVLIQGLPALLNSDKVVCMAGGGLISITDSGQKGSRQADPSPKRVKGLTLLKPKPLILTKLTYND